MNNQKTEFQPAHCTETALIKIKSDILDFWKKKKQKKKTKLKLCLLTLLDLSAAFDIIGYEILMMLRDLDMAYLEQCLNGLHLTYSTGINQLKLVILSEYMPMQYSAFHTILFLDQLF